MIPVTVQLTKSFNGSLHGGLVVVIINQKNTIALHAAERQLPRNGVGQRGMKLLFSKVVVQEK